MDITLHIPPDIEQDLLAEASAEGVSLDEFLAVLIRRHAAPPRATAPATQLSPDEWMDRFRAWLESNAQNTVVLPDDAMERESIYGDHGR